MMVEFTVPEASPIDIVIGDEVAKALKIERPVEKAIRRQYILTRAREHRAHSDDCMA